jgi:hypothetical protein
VADYKNKTEILKAVAELTADFRGRWQSRSIDAQIAEIADLEMDMQRPNFWDDPEKAKEISVKKSERLPGSGRAHD